MTKASLQRLAIGLFLLAAIASSTMRSSAAGGLKVSKQAEPSTTDQTQLRLTLSRGDCNFLKDPKIFGNPREHIHELSDATVRVTAPMIEANTDASSSKIPHNNYIDDEIFGKMERDGVQPAPLSTDEEFIRRVTLDLTGRIPTPDQVRNFTADTSPSKRNNLIDSLIGTPEFVDRWTMWMGDLLQNTAFSTNVIRYPQGRNAFYNTIKQAIQQNTPYNQFVTSLLTSSGNSFQNGAVNYIVGANTPMGPPQDTYDTAAVQMSKRFLGIDTLDCLLCHDGAGHLNALNLWATNTTRLQAWGMSAFFVRTGEKRNILSRMPLIVSTDINDLQSGDYMLNTTSGNRKPRQPVDGQSVINPKYLFTGETPAPSESYRTAVARFLTKDRQFARAAVNYLWAHFFSLGIVDPPTGFDLARLDPNNPPAAPWTIQPSHPELLEKLADDFIASNYNLQHMMRVMTQSSAYQLSARYPGEWNEAYTTYFARKLVRRLDAEEMHDAIARATGLLGNYEVYGFPNPIQWAMQLPDTIEPIPYSPGSGPAPRQDPSTVLARLFLNTFQRGNRDQVPRSNEPSILQGLSLMNSQFVMSRIHASNPNGTVARLLNSDKDDDTGLVQDLFLTVLSRQPTKKETTQALTLLKSNRGQGAEDLMWVLLNKVDFLYNY